MPKKWTGNLVGLMHNEKISFNELASELGVTNRYVSMVLNGHRDPEGAEEKFQAALDRIIMQRAESTASPVGTPES